LRVSASLQALIIRSRLKGRGVAVFFDAAMVFKYATSLLSSSRAIMRQKSTQTFDVALIIHSGTNSLASDTLSSAGAGTLTLAEAVLVAALASALS